MTNAASASCREVRAGRTISYRWDVGPATKWPDTRRCIELHVYHQVGMFGAYLRGVFVFPDGTDGSFSLMPSVGWRREEGIERYSQRRLDDFAWRVLAELRADSAENVDWAFTSRAGT